MRISRGWRAVVRTAPVWVVPVAAVILTVSLVFLCVPALEAA
jgi:hypothetical protein